MEVLCEKTKCVEKGKNNLVDSNTAVPTLAHHPISNGDGAPLRRHERDVPSENKYGILHMHNILENLFW